MQEIKDEYEEKGLVILTICGNDMSSIERFWADNELTMTVLFDSAYGIARNYGVDRYPVGIFFDRNGNIIDRELGWGESSLNEWKAKVENYL